MTSERSAMIRFDDIERRQWICCTTDHVQTPQFMAKMVSFNHYLYLFPGKDYDVIHHFDTVNNKWERVQCNKSFSCEDFSVIVVNHFAYIIGGYSEKCKIFKFNFLNHTMRNVEANGEIPKGRIGHSLCKIQNELIVYGGSVDSNSLFCTASLHDFLYSYNLETDYWLKVDIQNYPPCRLDHCAFVYKNDMYIYGGTNSRMCHVTYSDLWKLDWTLQKWTMITTFGTFYEKCCHSCAVKGDYFFSFGGFSIEDTPLLVYHFPKGEWKSLYLKGHVRPVHFAASAVCGDDWYIFGGYDQNTNYYSNDLIKLKIGIDETLFTIQNLKKVEKLYDIVFKF